MQRFLRHRFNVDAPAPSVRPKREALLDVNLLEGRLLLSTAPVTTAAVVSGTMGRDGFYVTPVTVDLTASDPSEPNGLTTFYRVDNGNFVSGNTVTLGDGVHVLQFYSVDQSGDREATESETFRIDTTVPVVTAHASPTTLWPPNHKFVPVTVFGRVTDASGGVPTSVHFRVIDEYGEVQPSGRAHVDADGRYSFEVWLQSSRLGQDKNGRLYTIVVTATDEAGNTGSARTFVLVPHDQGHNNGGENGNSQGGNNGNHGHGNGKGHGK